MPNPHILRSTGVETFAATFIETLLNPEIALGIVAIGHIVTGTPSEMAAALDLGGATTRANEAWQSAGYHGHLGEFVYSHRRAHGTPPHIDQGIGYTQNAPARMAALSIAQQGNALIAAQSFNTVLLPNEDNDYRPKLQDLRTQAIELDMEGMSIQTTHCAGEVLIIPTLPRPTAHAVEPINYRVTEIFDCVHRR